MRNFFKNILCVGNKKWDKFPQIIIYVKIKIKTQSKGLSKAATLNEETQEFILSNIL